MGDLKPVPCILGSMRSGTTMFCLMLNAHPEMAMAYESDFVTSMALTRDRWQRPDGFDADGYVDDLFEHPDAKSFRKYMSIPPEALREQLHGVASFDYAEAVRRVYRLYAETEGKPRYGEKTASVVRGLSTLPELFPEMRFVHIVRDGRDAANAHFHASWGANDLIRAGRLWAKHVTALRNLGQSAGPDRYLEIRYEQLVENTDQVLRSVCAFVDLEYDPQMLEYHVKGSNALTAVNVNQDSHHSVNLPPTRGLRDWRRDLDRRQLEHLEVAIGDTLETFGYDRGTRPSLRTRVELTVSRGKRFARRARRRLRRHRKART